MCHVCDLLATEADTTLADDYDAAFRFGECDCGGALEENGECPTCIQQAIDEKAMESAHLGHVVKYLVIDCPFNRENYPSLVSKTLDNPPAYALCCEVQG